MRARTRLRAALVLLLGSATAFGCASIFGLDELHEAPATSEASVTDATPPPSDASREAAAETGVDCTDPGYPAKPAADSPDGGDFSILVALSRIDFGLPGSGGGDAGDGGDAAGPPAVTGFNLDRVCTVDTKTESCVSGALGTNFTNYVLDKTDSGVDNAGGSLIQFISQMGPAFTPDAINSRLQSGQYGVVLGITGYTGRPTTRRSR